VMKVVVTLAVSDLSDDELTRLNLSFLRPTRSGHNISIRSLVCNIFSVVALNEMKNMHVTIWVEVEMHGINLDRIVILCSTMLTVRDSKITKIWPRAAISAVVHFSIARYIFLMIVFVCFAKRE